MGRPHPGSRHLLGGDDPRLRAIDQCLGKIPNVQWLIADIYGAIARISVPLFFMISGWLLLPRSESLYVFFTKRMTWRLNSLCRLVVHLLVLVLWESCESMLHKFCGAVAAGERHLLSPVVLVFPDQYLSNSPCLAPDVQAGFRQKDFLVSNWPLAGFSAGTDHGKTVLEL